MVCPKCGKENDEESKFCYACGNNLTVTVPTIDNNQNEFQQFNADNVEKTIAFDIENKQESKKKKFPVLIVSIIAVVVVVAILGILAWQMGWFSGSDSKLDSEKQIYSSYLEKQNLKDSEYVIFDLDADGVLDLFLLEKDNSQKVMLSALTIVNNQAEIINDSILISENDSDEFSISIAMKDNINFLMTKTKKVTAEDDSNVIEDCYTSFGLVEDDLIVETSANLKAYCDNMEEKNIRNYEITINDKTADYDDYLAILKEYKKVTTPTLEEDTTSSQVEIKEETFAQEYEDVVVDVAPEPTPTPTPTPSPTPEPTPVTTPTTDTGEYPNRFLQFVNLDDPIFKDYLEPISSYSDEIIGTDQFYLGGEIYEIKKENAPELALFFNNSFEGELVSSTESADKRYLSSIIAFSGNYMGIEVGTDGLRKAFENIGRPTESYDDMDSSDTQCYLYDLEKARVTVYANNETNIILRIMVSPKNLEYKKPQISSPEVSTQGEAETTYMQMLQDGSYLEYTENSAYADNKKQYAMHDIDLDGTPELIVKYYTDSVGFCMTLIFRYDDELKKPVKVYDIYAFGNLRYVNDCIVFSEFKGNASINSLIVYSLYEKLGGYAYDVDTVDENGNTHYKTTYFVDGKTSSIGISQQEYDDFVASIQNFNFIDF